MCTHVRQMRVADGVTVQDGLIDVTLRNVLPCAVPGCPDGARGERFIVPDWSGVTRARFAYEREPTPDGWRWFPVKLTSNP